MFPPLVDSFEEVYNIQTIKISIEIPKNIKQRTKTSPGECWCFYKNKSRAVENNVNKKKTFKIQNIGQIGGIVGQLTCKMA